MKKKGVLIALLIMAIGFASVTTTLYINGTSILKKNTNDFKVYYSDALVNGNQDLSVVVDETHLSFKTTLDTLGQTYVLDYDVTNGSKNYDAALTMSCTNGNDWLTVTNSFDTSTNLEALQTRSGTLTLTLSKSYTGSDLDVTIACTLNANAVERNSLGQENSPVHLYYIGEEITIADEKFNVISFNDDYVKMLAQFNLDENYRQNEELKPVAFSDEPVWERGTDIDIQTTTGFVKTYVNNYATFLEGELGENSVTGDLILLSELKKLGCGPLRDDNDYPDADASCNISEHSDWLVTKQDWWTRSAYTSPYMYSIWTMYGDGELYDNAYYNENGVRPTITVSKEILDNYLGY